MNVSFLRPGQSNDALDKLLSVLREGKPRVSIAVAYLTHDAIIDELLTVRPEREVSLILNSHDFFRPGAADISKLVVPRELRRLLREAQRCRGSLEIRSLGQRQFEKHLMHHKFAVSHDSVIFGSANWTVSALSTNYELVVATKEHRAIDAFQEEFDALWKLAQPLMATDGSIRTILCPKCRDGAGVDFESWGPFCLYCEHRFEVGDAL